MSLKIVTWNINSVRLRLPLVAAFVQAHGPDVLCLQETKVVDELFPALELRAMGFDHMVFRGQKGYNGVAILSKLPLEEYDRQNFCGKEEARHIAARLPDGTVVHNLYIPAGGDKPNAEINPKFAHKMQFLDELKDYFAAERQTNDRAVVVGDFNVAPREHDVWDHKKMLRIVTHTPIEVEKMNAVLTAGGWVDVIRDMKPEPEKLYSWWSYRARPAWDEANKGRRLDHIWVTESLAEKAQACEFHRPFRGMEQPSDHVPVVLELA